MIGRFASFDDFFPDPERVRSIALAGAYRELGGAFTGSEYRCPEFPMDLVFERLAVLTGQALRYDAGRPAVFRALTRQQQDAKRGRIHLDRVGCACIVCLNEHCDADAATSFHRHRATGLEGLHHASSAALRLGTTPRRLRARVEADGPHVERWEEVGSVAYRFNRLIVFDSRLFHAAAAGFGTDLGSAKLTMNFAFWPYRRWRPTVLSLFTTALIPPRSGGVTTRPERCAVPRADARAA